MSVTGSVTSPTRTGPGNDAADGGPTGRERRWRRLAARGPSPWWVLSTVAVLGAHLLMTTRLGGFTATVGEARIAAAAAAARIGRSVADPLPWPVAPAARQLGAVETVLPWGDLAAIDAARTACLLLAAVAALLLWPVLRAFGASPPVAAVGVVLAGASPWAVVLHAGVSTAAPAAVWLGLAAGLAARSRRPAPALLAAVLAALTAPLAGAALLAMAAHLVLGRTVPVPARLRVPLGTAAATLAAVVAVAAASPVVGVGGAALSTPVALVAGGAGLVVLVLAHRRVPWLRPVITPLAVLLAFVVLPGPVRTTAAVLVLPGLAVVVGVLIGPRSPRAADTGGRPVAPSRWREPVAALAVVGLLLAGSVGAVLGRAPTGPDRSLAGWAATELPVDVAVRADGLDRIALLAAGFPADRLRGPSDPVGPGEVRLVSSRPVNGLPDAASAGCPAAAAVAVTARGTGGAPAVLCGPAGRASAADGGPGLGEALAGNPGVRTDPRAAELLRSGRVDVRVITVLAALASARELQVADFPAVELDAPGSPRRQVLLVAVDGGAAAADPLLPNWLSAQRPPYTPAAVRPSGDAVVVSWYAAVPLPE